MAVHAVRVNVGAAPTALNANDAGDMSIGKSLVVRNRSATAVDIGGADVATGAGFQLDAGDVASVDLEIGEILFAVGPSAGPFRLDVLRLGVA